MEKEEFELKTYRTDVGAIINGQYFSLPKKIENKLTL